MHFTLTLEEANLVLSCLAKQPFEAVSGLIQKLQMQAAPQLVQPSDEEPIEETKPAPSSSRRRAEK